MEVDLVEKLFEVQGLEQNIIHESILIFMNLHDRIREEAGAIRDSIASTLANGGNRDGPG